MRDLDAAYTAALATTSYQSIYQVRVSDWGGAPDPLDITDRVIGWSLTRSLRGAVDKATLVVDNADGAFDPGGAWEEVLAPNTATIEIKAGEVVNGTSYLYAVLTGGVLSCGGMEQVPDGPLRVQVGNRGRDLAGIKMTSALYGDPAPAQADHVVKELFKRFAGFADADFDLSPLAFFLDHIQFENESLLAAANACVQPLAKRVYFGYDGRLKHGDLLPATWDPVLALPSAAIPSLGYPRRGAPDATRIFVSGGPSGEERPILGDPEPWATIEYAFYSKGLEGDGEPYRLFRGDYSRHWFSYPGYLAYIYAAGPTKQLYRVGYTGLDTENIRWAVECGEIQDIHIVGDSGGWNAGAERMECVVYVQIRAGTEMCGLPAGDVRVDFAVDVMGHPHSSAHPTIDVQAWDDSLIAAYGEKGRTVQAPCACRYEDAEAVAAMELAFVQKSVSKPRVELPRADLRIEPGDVVTVNRARGDAFDLWVHEVTLAYDRQNGLCSLTGMVA